VAPKPNTPGRSGTARKAPGIPVAPPAAPTGIERGRRVEAAAARQGAEPVARPTITIDDLNGNTCRFITTDRSPFLYCGEATFAGTPYCKEHALRCYQIGRRAA
jgi:hypothetical protein